MKRHQELLTEAIEREGDGQRLLLEGDADAARAAFGEAAKLYRESWAVAPPRSYGRLVGMLKSAVLSGGGTAEATFVGRALSDEGEDSPTASYARALAWLIAGNDDAAARASRGMHGGSDAFDRTAEAIAALAAGERRRYVDALAQIVRDFEDRSEHLTGLAVADTALVLECLAARRGVSAGIASRVMPALR